MPYPINQIDDLAAEELKKLKSLGIRTTDRLLEEAKTPRGRSLLAAKTGFDQARILGWANAADRMRIKGMGKGYSCLLKAVGVDTVKELKYRNPAKLAEAIATANARNKLARVLPSPRAIERWIEQAKRIQLKITYR